ncbi:MAG: FlgD immunoglobulin-like domain containing protein, partial [Candidatus Omnitrophica bacterium]|nr:FlgD immunoglobulin-like domain containing protein [Candidatus Omnitrophota bacterium]
DGKDIAEEVVPDGVYRYKIEATDPVRSVNATPVTSSITADTDLPIAAITSPVDGAVVGSTVAITGTASDNNIRDYVLEYGQGDTPISWTLIDRTLHYSVTDGLLANWDSAKVSNGIYTVRLTATDIANHAASAQVCVTVDNIQITNVSVLPDTINPHNGESSTITYALDRDADITIKLYDLDNNLKRILIIVTPHAAGVSSQIWDGKDDNGEIVPQGAYTITIEAQSGAARGWYQSLGGFVPNVVRAPDFKITQDFNPYNNEPCVIEYTLPENALILLQAGQHEVWQYVNIRDWEIQTRGYHREYWNGRDRTGNILDYYTDAYPIIVGYRTQSLPENSIVVTAPMQEASIDIWSDPYCFMPCFGEFTTISYVISQSGRVTISIQKPSGETINTLVNNVFMEAGTHTITWDGTDPDGNIVDRDDNYIIKAEFTAEDGTTAARYGNITTR